MARIRSIKPEFPQSESMGKVSRDARLLFVELWCICDDHGRTRAVSRMLASLLFPYDDDAPKLIDGWLSELQHQGCIRLYDHAGSQYLEICNWLKHQKIDKPSKPLFPGFVESSRGLANPLECSCEEGKGKERKGKDLKAYEPNGSLSVDVPPPNPPPVKNPQAERQAERLAQVTDEAINAFNASPLAKPNGLLAKVSTTVGRVRRQQQVKRCIKIARDICREGYDAEKITAEFWVDYWAICSADDFLAGRGGRSEEHANWMPDFEYLTRPKTMLKVYERADA